MNPALATARNKTGVVSLVVSLALLAAMFLLFPVRAAAQGWVLAFGVWSGFPMGALLLLMIHRLTGGEWGDALAPVLRTGAMLLTLVFAALVLIVVLQTKIYPWQSGGVDESVGRFYLNTIAFTLRTAVTACGLLVLGIAFGRGAGSPLSAGLGLAFYGLTISFGSIDWFLSLDPQHVATTFGAIIGVQQLLTALAIGAVMSPPGLQKKVANDLGGLIIATLLGVAYLELMTYIVQWYGDLPDKVEWYARRAALLWRSALIASAALATLAFALLILHRIRSSRVGLRVAGGLVLASIGLHWVWLIGPEMQDPWRGLGAALMGGVALLLLTHLSATIFEPESDQQTPKQPVRNLPEPRHLGSSPRPGLLLLLLLAFIEQLKRSGVYGRKERIHSVESYIAQTGNDTRNLEPPDIDHKAVLAIAFGFLGLVALSAAGLGLYFHESTPAPLFPAVQGAPSPKIAFPSDEARRLRNEQAHALDAPDGEGNIAIERAMAAIAARGKDAFNPVGPAAIDTHAEGSGK